MIMVMEAATPVDAELLEFLKELDRNDSIDPLPPDRYYFPIEESLAKDEVVSTESFPGFARDLTSWILWLSESGRLSVIVNICKPFEQIDKHYRFEEVCVGRREVHRVLKLANRIGFGDFPDKFECNIEDMPYQRVVVRLCGRLKRVHFCGNHPPGFWEFWRRIHRYAPVVNRYLPWWARGWRGGLFD